jgi:hypothetical protein
VDRHEGFTINKDPLFDGSNYVFWSIRMRTSLIDLGFDIWSVVKNGYIAPKIPHVDAY